MSIINRIPRAYSSASGDPYSVLLLHCDGSDGSTTFLDESTGGSTHTMTANVNAQVDTSFKQFGTGSLIGDRTQDTKLSTPYSADFYPGAGDYTIDCWVRITGMDTAGFGICGNLAGSPSNSSGFCLSILGGSTFTAFAFIGSGAGGGAVAQSTETISYDTLTHIALVITSGYAKVAVGGVFSGTSLPATFVNNALDFVVGDVYGANSNYNWEFNGHIDELRVSKGIARWTTNFTPPTSPYTE